MKLFGKKINPPKPSFVVIPREDGDFVFHARAVLDYSEFDKMCPNVEPPMVQLPGGGRKYLADDKKFLKAITDRSERRVAWMAIMSLDATEGLEWETVDLNDPTTWMGYEKELHDAGLTETEVTRIINCVMEANSLDDRKYKEARDRFTRQQAALLKGESSLKDEPLITQSGALANDLESSLQV